MLRGAGLSAASVGAIISPGVRAGVTLGPDIRSVGASTTAVSADTLYMHPVLVPEPVSCVGLAVSVGTAVAGVLGKMGLYASAQRGLNGALIEECAGTVDMNALAATVLQTNFAAPRTLFGWYWVASIFNGAAQPYTMPQGGSMGSGTVSLYGAPTLAPFTRSVGGSAVFTRATAAAAYASAFPTLPTLTFGTASPGCPIMGIVVA